MKTCEGCVYYATGTTYQLYIPVPIREHICGVEPGGLVVRTTERAQVQETIKKPSFFSVGEYSYTDLDSHPPVGCALREEAEAQ